MLVMLPYRFRPDESDVLSFSYATFFCLVFKIRSTIMQWFSQAYEVKGKKLIKPRWFRKDIIRLDIKMPGIVMKATTNVIHSVYNCKSFIYKIVKIPVPGQVKK